LSTFLLIAKAGGSSEAPENTCEAVSRVARLRPESGVELGIEVDLRLSADRRFVALHDARLERTTSGRGFVSQHSLGELRRLKAGPHGERVPALREVLEAAGDWPVLLDLHDDDVAAAAALCHDLDGVPRQRRERLWVASEHGRVVDALRRLDPTLRTAATKREAWRKLLLGWMRLARFAPRGRVWIVPERHSGLRVASRRFVDDARQAGDAVWVFVVDDLATLARLRAWGVSGCLTTRPAELIAALSRRAKSSVQEEAAGRLKIL